MNRRDLRLVKRRECSPGALATDWEAEAALKAELAVLRGPHLRIELHHPLGVRVGLLDEQLGACMQLMKAQQEG